MKRKALLLIIPFAAAGLAGCQQNKPNPPAPQCDPSGATINKEALTIHVGDVDDSVVANAPSACTFSWSSSDESVATVSADGEITGVAEGTATIKYADASGTGVSCTVTVVGAGEHIHTFSDEWSTDENYHWHASTCGHDVVGDQGAHVDKVGDDGKCDVCGYDMSHVVVSSMKEAYEAAAALENGEKTEEAYEFTGIVTAIMNGNGGDTNYYTQDGVYGIDVFKKGGKLDGVKVGSKIKVKATMQKFSDVIETETIQSLDVLGDEAVPAPLAVSSYDALAAAKLNVLAKITGSVKGFKAPVSGKDYSLILTVGGQDVTVFTKKSIIDSLIDSLSGLSDGMEVTIDNAVTAIHGTTYQLLTTNNSKITGSDIPVVELDHIAIEGTATKTKYVEGQSYSADGLHVETYYKDTTHKSVTATITPEKAKAAFGDTSIKFIATYQGMTAELPVTVEVTAKPAPTGDNSVYTFTNDKTQSQNMNTWTSEQFMQHVEVEGSEVITGIKDITNAYIGANGGSDDAVWELWNCFKVGKSNAGGTATLTLDSSVLFESIKVSAIGNRDDGTLTINGVTKNVTKKAVKGDLEPMELEFDIAGGISELVISSKEATSGNYGISITKIEFVGGGTPIEPSVEKVELDKSTLNLQPDGSAKLTATVTVKGGAAQTVTWSSDNEAIATVDNDGTVHAVAVGDANITATSTVDSSKSATCAVSVTAAPVAVLQSIQVTTAPNKTNYKVGESFDPTGIVVKAHYSIGDDVDITSNCTFTPSGALALDSVVKAHYSEGTINVECNVNVTISKPTPEGYVEYDFSKIEGFGEWGSGYAAAHSVEYTDVTVNFEGAAKQTTTITDIPVAKKAAVTVVAKNGKEMAGFSGEFVKWGSKSKTVYLDYSVDGGATYVDTEISSTEFAVAIEELPAGTNALRVRFNDSDNQIGISKFLVKFVATEPAKTLDELTIKTNPNKTSYKEGETFDATGLVLHAVYSNGDENDVDTGWIIEPEGALSVGTTKVTVSFGGKSVDVLISVAARVLNSIEITTGLTTKEYTVGQSWATSELVVTAHYNDGDSVLSSDKYTLTADPEAPALNVTSVTFSVKLVADESKTHSITEDVTVEAAPVATTISVPLTGYAGSTTSGYVNKNTTSEISGVTFNAYGYNPGNGQIRGNKGSVGTSTTEDSNSNFHIYNTTALNGLFNQISVSCVGSSGSFTGQLFIAYGNSSLGDHVDVDAENVIAAKLSSDNKTFVFDLNTAGSFTYFKVFSNATFTSGTVDKAVVTLEKVAAPVSIEKVTAPETVYKDSITVKGVTVDVNFDDKSTKIDLPATKVEVDTSKLGVTTATAYYGSLSKTFEIEVIERSVEYEEKTYLWVSGSDSTGKIAKGSNTLEGVAWSSTAAATNYNSGNYKGLQIGSSSGAGSLVLTSSSAWGVPADDYEGLTAIKEIKIWMNTGGSAMACTVTIGENTIASDGKTVSKNSSCSSYADATCVTYTPVEGKDTGIIVLDFESAKAGYICAIQIICHN